MASQRLLLFDIDGTLIDTEGAGLESLKEGFYESFPEASGREFPPLDLGGATDGSVAAFLFEHFEVEHAPPNVKRFFDCYSVSLTRRLALFRALGRGRALPGTGTLLEELSKREEFTLGLLTGNTETGARIKLRHFEMDHHFEFGAFGDDHPDRNELGPIAIDRASEHSGVPFAAEQVIVIGDTVKDIACARACGAYVIAVSTGTCSSETLGHAAPDELLGDLEDVAAVFAALERLVPS